MVFGGPDYPGSPHIFQKLIKRVKSTDAHVMKLEWPWLLVSLVAQVALVAIIAPLTLMVLVALMDLVALAKIKQTGQQDIVNCAKL